MPDCDGTKKSKRKCQCLKFQDTRYCILDTKLKSTFGFQLQIWERAGKALSVQREAFKSQAKGITPYETEQRKAFRQTVTVTGQFAVWDGGGVEDRTPNGLFNDISLTTESPELVLFARFSLQAEFHEATQLMEVVLSSLVVHPLNAWTLDS